MVRSIHLLWASVLIYIAASGVAIQVPLTGAIPDANQPGIRPFYQLLRPNWPMRIMPHIYADPLDPNLRPRLSPPMGPFGLIHPWGLIEPETLLDLLRESRKAWIYIPPQTGKPEDNEDANNLAHARQQPDWLTPERIDRAVE